MRAPNERVRALPLGVSAAAVLVLACVNVKGSSAQMAGAGTSGAGTAGSAGGAAGSVPTGTGGGGAAGLPYAPPRGCQPHACTDFPADPLIDVGVTPDAPAMFALPPTGAGPCITEPEDGALFPNNWLRPRVRFTPAVRGTLHEVRFHSDLEANGLVAYTTSDTWTLPKAIWNGLAAGVRSSPITVTVRALDGGASTVTFTIAPVPAPGSIVFWATNPADHGAPKPTSSSLQGFAPGDEATITTLAVGDVQMKTRNANNSLRDVTCIGCHNSTPDGSSVGFIDNYPWGMAIVGIEPGRRGLKPTYLTPGGEDAIGQPGLGIFSFSRAHWAPGDHIVVAPYYLDVPCGQYSQRKPDLPGVTTQVRLAWLDVEAPLTANGCPVEGTQFGIIKRDGDARGAGNPTWSHDGKTIVYSSAEVGQDGRLDTGHSDLFAVPYNNRAGGPATPLPGASEPDFEEYYPAFSPDDALVVFDRIPPGGAMYANPAAELFVVPAPSDASGASPTVARRLAANDPPTCSGKASPGINNHWAKWAPEPEMAPGSSKKYYWLIFSSNRFGTPAVLAQDGSTVQVSQLYATAIVVDETSTQTFPAIYLWNQSATTLNTTPAWDPFKIPVVP